MTIWRTTIYVNIFFLLTLTLSCSTPEEKKIAHFSKAMEYIKKADDKTAIIELRNAIQLDPKFADARYQLSLLYLKMGNAQNAFQELQRTTSLDPENLDASTKLAEFYLISKNKDDSRKFINRVLEKNPTYADALALLANLEIIEGNFDKALKTLEKVPTAELEADRFYNIKGRIFASQKQWPQAEEMFNSAIEANPKNFSNYRTLLLMYQQQERLTDVEILLKKMGETFPENSQPHLFLASLYESKKEYTKAEEELQQAMEIDKDEPGLRIHIFEYYKRRRQVDKAEQSLIQAVTDIPDSLELQAVLANLWFDKKDFEKAETKMNEILSTNKEHGGATLLKVKFMFKDGLFSDSIDLLNRLHKDFPKWDEPPFYISLAHYNLGAIELSQKNIEKAITLSPRKSKYRTLLAQILLQQRETKLAEKEAQTALQLENRNIQAALILAKTYLQGKEYEKAEKILERMKKQLPPNREVLMTLSLTYLGQKEKEKAKTTLEELLAISPSDTRSLAIFTQLSAEGDLSKAEEVLNKYIQKVPGHGLHYLILGDILLRKKDYAASLEAYKKVQELSPENPQGYIKSATLMRQQGKTEEAILEFKDLIGKQPSDIRGYMGLATLLELENKHAEAMKNYQKVLSIKPDFAPAANNLAWRIAEQKNGDLGEALRLAMLAKQAVPDEPHIADTLGWVHLKRKSYSLAESQFEHAVSLKNDDPTLLYHLALAQHGNEKTAEAMAGLKNVLKQYKDFPERTEVEEKLKEWSK